MIDLKWLIAGATVAIIFVAGWIGYEVGKDQIQMQWTQSELEMTQLYAKQVQELRQKEWELNQQLMEAQKNAQLRETTLQRNAARARAAADSLREQLEEANARIVTATQEALVEYTNTVNTVFAECTTAYRELAEKADGHANDAMMLLEAYPE